jgi:hypothetical protein
LKRGLRVSAGLSGAAVVVAALLQCLAAPQVAWAQSARPEDAAIVRHLNAAITWYKQLTSANESAGQPSDAFYLENARTLARQALQLAFQSAESEAQLLLAERGGVLPVQAMIFLRKPRASNKTSPSLLLPPPLRSAKSKLKSTC